MRSFATDARTSTTVATHSSTGTGGRSSRSILGASLSAKKNKHYHDHRATGARSNQRTNISRAAPIVVVGGPHHSKRLYCTKVTRTHQQSRNKSRPPEAEGCGGGSRQLNCLLVGKARKQAICSLPIQAVYHSSDQPPLH